MCVFAYCVFAYNSRTATRVDTLRLMASGRSILKHSLTMTGSQSAAIVDCGCGGEISIARERRLGTNRFRLPCTVPDSKFESEGTWQCWLKSTGCFHTAFFFFFQPTMTARASYLHRKKRGMHIGHSPFGWEAPISKRYMWGIKKRPPHDGSRAGRGHGAKVYVWNGQKER